MSTSRSSFNKTWLVEMPAKLDVFDIVARGIKDWIAHGQSPTKLSDTLCVMSGENIVYYWHQTDNDIIAAVELEKRPQGFLVNVAGKNPKYRTKPPFVTDLYQDIILHEPLSLLFSDNQLSTDGISLWKNLMKNGNVVSVFNPKNPGNSFQVLTNPEQLDEYLGPDKYHYRVVLSRKGLPLAETKSYFAIRRYRELSNMFLEDL